jgi:regulator of nonsense transcripts 2
MPDDFFRIRLVCVLLDACGMCFDRGSQKRKLDNFLIFFQVCWFLSWPNNTFELPVSQLYVMCKDPLPMDVEFMLSDSLEVGVILD